MITAQININGNCVFARSATRIKEPDKEGKATYKADDGNILKFNPKDGAKELAKKLIDLIEEV